MRSFMDRHRFVRLCGAALAMAGIFWAVSASPVAEASTQVTLYASPTGTATTTCAITAPCSLTGAQAVVESLTPTMTGDIVVELRGGDYRLSSPWTFSSAAGDSGTNGYQVIYTNYPGETPEIMGSQQVTGWTLHNSALNIWSANVGVGFQTRELYVNGVRAEIARGPSNPAGWTPTATGLTAPDSSMASWPDVVGAEVVSENTWVHKSCPIMAASGTSITLAEPCYNNAELPYDFASGAVVDSEPFNVSWVQNAYELLTQPGMFYLNSGTGTLYYIPRPGENLATADVEAPFLQSLVTGAGTETTPLSNITFSGLTFEYATWLVPSLPTGYAEGQAGWHITGSDLTSVPMSDLTPTPGEVKFNHDSDLTFSGDTFTHMGSVALELNEGSQNDTIIGSAFTDIGSNAIQIGDVDTADRFPAAADEVTNNTVPRQRDHPGRTGLSKRGRDLHWLHDRYGRQPQRLGQLPYTAISVNLGWEGTSYSGDATITDNEIYQDMTVLNDGGALYTQMAMRTVDDGRGTTSTTRITPVVLRCTSTPPRQLDRRGQRPPDGIGGVAQHPVLLWCARHGQHGGVQLQQRVRDAARHARSVEYWSNNNYDNLTTFPAGGAGNRGERRARTGLPELLTARTVNDNSSTMTYRGPGWNLLEPTAATATMMTICTTATRRARR